MTDDDSKILQLCALDGGDLPTKWICEVIA